MRAFKSYGLLTAYENKEEVVVAYRGNMTCTVDVEVRNCFEKLFGVGSFDKLLMLEEAKTEGGACYVWSCTWPRKLFMETFMSEKERAILNRTVIKSRLLS